MPIVSPVISGHGAVVMGCGPTAGQADLRNRFCRPTQEAADCQARVPAEVTAPQCSMRQRRWGEAGGR